MNEIAINTTNGNYTVSSLQIAESFEKQHKNVIRDIEKIIAECVENRSAQNCADLFIASTYADSSPCNGLHRQDCSGMET